MEGEKSSWQREYMRSYYRERSLTMTKEERDRRRGQWRDAKRRQRRNLPSVQVDAAINCTTESIVMPNICTNQLENITVPLRDAEEIMSNECLQNDYSIVTEGEHIKSEDHWGNTKCHQRSKMDDKKSSRPREHMRSYYRERSFRMTEEARDRRREQWRDAKRRQRRDLQSVQVDAAINCTEGAIVMADICINQTENATFPLKDTEEVSSNVCPQNEYSSLTRDEDIENKDRIVIMDEPRRDAMICMTNTYCSSSSDNRMSQFQSKEGSSPLASLARIDLWTIPKSEMQDEVLRKVETIKNHSQKLEDDLRKLGLKIKHHEDNLKFLKAQTNSIDESIRDMEVSLGRNHSTTVAEDEGTGIYQLKTEQDTIEHILQQEKTAAGIICQMKIRHGPQSSKLPLTKDVLGIVATLGKVNDENLSRVLSEYLGLQTMLAIVCNTYEGVKALEIYDREGTIDKSAGLHGLGPSIGRPLDGRFLVICLEHLRPYVGEFVAEDPQKKLDLLNPRLPSGECPPGFLGFAVNMIDVDHKYLSCFTADGRGLRETLFYSLFSRLQVYRTRANMQLALPCISDSAISLDGGIMKSIGSFSLGERKDVEVRFPISCGLSSPPTNIIKIQEQLKLMNWRKERFAEDMQREEALLNHVKSLFSIKKEELLKCLKDNATDFPQHVPQTQVLVRQKQGISDLIIPTGPRHVKYPQVIRRSFIFTKCMSVTWGKEGCFT